MSVDALVRQIEQLPEADRGELLDRLEELYGDEEETIEISEETRKMLEERDADCDANPNDGYTWEEVVAYVKRKK